jgi:predicted xylose isomerase-like sugar epimerase
VLDIVGFMQRLQKIGFNGPVMPEPFSKALDDLAAIDPLAAAKETARSMNELWSAAGL